MAIEITTGGITKTYRYYPYDAFYVSANGSINASGDGEQVKEAYFNGVKYYPEEYAGGIVALRGIDRHPAGVTHNLTPSARNAVCAEVYNQGSYELSQSALASYEVSWAYLGLLKSGRTIDQALEKTSEGGFRLDQNYMRLHQFMFSIKYSPNVIDRNDLRQDGQTVFDLISNGTVMTTPMVVPGGIISVDGNSKVSVTSSFSSVYTDSSFEIESRLDIDDNQTSYSNHTYWTVVYRVYCRKSTNQYTQGHERYFELFEPTNLSSLTPSDLL